MPREICSCNQPSNAKSGERERESTAVPTALQGRAVIRCQIVFGLCTDSRRFCERRRDVGRSVDESGTEGIVRLRSNGRARVED